MNAIPNDDPTGIGLSAFLVDDPADATVIAALVPGAVVGTFDEALDGGMEAGALADRDVIAVVPGDAGPAMLSRAQDATRQAQAVAHEARIVSWPAWQGDTPFAPPQGIDSPGAMLAWIGCLPPLAAPPTPGQNGTPPAGTGLGDAWPALRLADVPEVMPFPLDVLPDPAAALVRAGADAIGCAPDFLALPILATAAGAIGRSVSLLLKRGYFARASLYGAIIGPPSDGKSPALSAVTDAVRRIDRHLAARHADALARWQASGGTDEKGKAKKPTGTPPRPQRIDVDDTTTEALVLTMADNPRGLLLILDELSALVSGLNQYKSKGGNDKQVYLAMWSGKAIKRDRVLNPDGMPIRVPHPHLSIVGGMTPDILPEMADPRGRDDGWIDRFLFVYPDPRPVPEWTDRGIPDEIQADWADLVWRLWERSLAVKEGETVPHVAYLTREGQARWETHYAAHAREMNAPGFPPALRGPWGKLREYVGRLALVLTLMHHAADPTADQSRIPDVDGPMVDRAWMLMTYFSAHTRRVHGAIVGGPASSGRVVRAIVDWVCDNGRDTFTERDIKQAREWITPDDLDAATKYLTDRGAIRRLPSTPAGHRGGRPPSPAYEVHPELFRPPQNAQNLQNRGASGGAAGRSEGSEGFEGGSRGESALSGEQRAPTPDTPAPGRRRVRV